MSLLSIARKVWRYKLATLPVLVFVAIGTAYVVAVKKPVYEASSSYILVNPPTPPTEGQIARNPELGRINSDNPYTRYSDQSVVVQVLADRLSSEEARGALAKRGADAGYTVAPSAEFGYTAPILKITGTGSTAPMAVKTADVLGRAATTELDRMQGAQGVAEKYRIIAQEVVAAHGATLKASSKLRALLGVFALGVILLFVVVSVADALTALRRGRAEHHLDGGLGQDPAGGATLAPLPSLDLDPAMGSPARDASDRGPFASDRPSAPGDFARDVRLVDFAPESRERRRGG
jgi:hypothetical protein